MNTITCTMFTLDFSDRHESVKKVAAEFRGGFAEIYPKHQDLFGSLALGTITIEKIIDEKSIFIIYVAQDGLATIDNDDPSNTIVDIIATKGIEITKDLTYEFCNSKYEEFKKKLNNIFENLNIDDPESYEEFDERMDDNFEFFYLQKEIAFWNKVRKTVKELEKQK